MTKKDDLLSRIAKAKLPVLEMQILASNPRATRALSQLVEDGLIARVKDQAVIDRRTGEAAAAYVATEAGMGLARQ